MDSLNQFIDHTLLRSDARPEDIETLCAEAKKYNFYSVCVNPTYIDLCKRMLQQTPIKVCTVVDFPLGASGVNNKAGQTDCCVREGAQELDMVIPIGLLKAGRKDNVLDHISAVIEASRGLPVKVIVETALLDEKEKLVACELVARSGAAFIKTSTGMQGGAELDDIRLFKQNLPDSVKIKASGGIRDYASALQFVEAGAHRLGTSRSAEIMEEALSQK